MNRNGGRFRTQPVTFMEIKVRSITIIHCCVFLRIKGKMIWRKKSFFCFQEVDEDSTTSNATSASCNDQQRKSEENLASSSQDNLLNPGRNRLRSKSELDLKDFSALKARPLSFHHHQRWIVLWGYSWLQIGICTFLKKGSEWTKQTHIEIWQTTK